MAAARAGSIASSPIMASPVESIRTDRDVLFDGTGPDPSEENLAPLKKPVLEKKSLAGLATDGDADRFGILDRDGTFCAAEPHSRSGLRLSARNAR